MQLLSFIIYLLPSLQQTSSCIRRLQLEKTQVVASGSALRVSPTVTSEKGERYDILLDWLASKGAFISPKLRVGPSSLGGGNGVFIQEEVDKEELLFSIPRSACVSARDATSDKLCGDAFQQVIERAGPGGATVVMAGYLAKAWLEYLHDAENEKAGGGTSELTPYLVTLPWERNTNDQDHILYWSKEEIESRLKGTMCYEEATALRREVGLATKVLNGIVGRSIQQNREGNSGFKWPWETDTATPDSSGFVSGLPEAVRGAFVALLTRSFEYSDEKNASEERLVPLLDMLQHSNDPNVSHAVEDGAVMVRSRRALSTGDELFNQYRADLPYHRFFTRFGFIPGIQEPIQNLLNDRSSIFFPLENEV